MRGLSTSASSCPRRCRFLRPLPESQFFCGPESPEFPRVPAVRRSSTESHGLVTEPVPCSLHASLTDERLRARSPASDGDDHDPDEGTAMGTRGHRTTRRTLAGRGRMDTRGSVADPTRVRPAEPSPRADGMGRQRLLPPGRRLRPPLVSARPGHPPARAGTRSHNPHPGRSAPARGRSTPDHDDPDRTADVRVGSTASCSWRSCNAPSPTRCLVLKPNRPPAGSRSGPVVPRPSPSAR